MLLRFDPFRELDRLAGEMLGAARGTAASMPMDCVREDDRFVVRFDLPGIDSETLDVSAEGNTLTVRAERHRDDPEDASYLVSERPAGVFTRRLTLGDDLDIDKIEATYADGVLTLTIPLAEEAKPRKIMVHRAESAGRTEEPTTIDSHEGQKMITNETGQDRVPAAAAA